MLIAITGGIGGGKSEVVKILSGLTDNVVSADKINAELLNDAEYIKKISAEFPETVKGGAIDKKALSAIIFSDEKRRARLNEIAHAAIKDALFQRLRAMKGAAFAEVPLLREAGLQDGFDEVWLVVSDRDKRISRLKADRGMSETEILSVMNAQACDETRASAAYRIIENNGSTDELKDKVTAMFFDTYEKNKL
ncbi:MAG: dephospho-CoA kinase [Clostridiales bacterium]|jgi:dephospho-CoA kinase|nr:dephospho-CoA kinase [Clostridiales bacterium]